MATKFAEFLQTQKIDPRRLIASSRQIERLRPEDRAARLLARRNRKKESSDDEGADGEKAKRRSGRTITPRLITGAQSGKAVSGSAKTRLLRAVNRLLEQRKQDPVDLRALF
ncbi:MAG: hypothetical protein KIT72_18570 [Polyangiaceae bacterium]|nr:hypothetical protein [Polyangiaceae bacterium]MCW5792423.1 hypothetical protein [Polyangiaceae bacterium]